MKRHQGFNGQVLVALAIGAIGKSKSSETLDISCRYLLIKQYIPYHELRSLYAFNFGLQFNKAFLMSM